MFATCLFCDRPLETNDAIEHFPIGRRLAFDAAKGRLWVVCKKCERWNLTPLHERWEAIEECERAFRDTRVRMSTDNIGLAKLNEGLELVRIGEPLRPEFAAWRYGDQFGRRRKRAIIWTAAGVAVVGGLAAGALAIGASGVVFAQVPNFLNMRTRVKIRARDGRVLKVRRYELLQARILPGARDRGWSLYVKHSRGNTTFEGEEALRVAGLVLPQLNVMAGSKRTIADAVAAIEAAGDPERYLAGLPDLVRRAHGPQRPYYGRPLFPGKPGVIHRLPAPTKLAIEMALHEEQERVALAGELLTLEEAWREAEEVAAIADDLLVPKEVEEFIERHRTGDGSA